MKPYIIQKNDTLWAIASRELGSGFRWHKLWEINHSVIQSEQRKRAVRLLKQGPHLIYAGTQLMISTHPHREGIGRAALKTEAR